MQTVLKILNKSAEYFASKGVPNSKLDAQLLLADVLGCKRLELFLNFERPLDDSQLAKMRDYVRRRARREPLQHILGNVEFFGVKLKCDRRGLVPRPETEEMCAIVAERLFTDADAALKILDLGTGSGAIAAALAAHYKNASITAADFSADALSLARENFAELKNVEAIQSDWFSKISGSFDLIISNPPYLTDAEVADAQPEVRDFDPRAALSSPDSGMADLRKILSSASSRLTSGGWIICECGLGQPEKLCAEFAPLYALAEAINDSSHRSRFVLMRAK